MACNPFGSEFGASPFDDIFTSFFDGSLPKQPVLLCAATRQEPVRRLLAGASADPEAIAGQVESPWPAMASPATRRRA